MPQQSIQQSACDVLFYGTLKIVIHITDHKAFPCFYANKGYLMSNNIILGLQFVQVWNVFNVSDSSHGSLASADQLLCHLKKKQLKNVLTL